MEDAAARCRSVCADGGAPHASRAGTVLLRATQNPIEQEGTYPLPELRLDRFMMQLTVAYPTREEEERIVTATTGDRRVDIEPMLDANQLLDLHIWCGGFRSRRVR